MRSNGRSTPPRAEQSYKWQVIETAGRRCVRGHVLSFHLFDQLGCTWELGRTTWKTSDRDSPHMPIILSVLPSTSLTFTILSPTCKPVPSAALPDSTFRTSK
mmetsp:Transcript_68875/g.165329  ORF Transcript_68875/g.165329 Transcript_68875/m.165329 type:complete len:102 (-) Transcript_68875:496-801(-)